MPEKVRRGGTEGRLLRDSYHFCPSWVVSDRIASTVRRSRLLAPLRGSTTRRFFFVTFALSSVLAAPLRMTRNAVLCVRYTVFIRLR